MQPLLLVDDNDKYARILDEYFKGYGFKSERAHDAAEGLAMLKEKGLEYYPMIVTDVTMETQTSGLSMLRKMRRMGYPGLVIIASTGFDVIFAKTLSRLFIRNTGVTYMIPKKSVLAEKPEFHHIKFNQPVLPEFPGLGSD